MKHEPTPTPTRGTRYRFFEAFYKSDTREAVPRPRRTPFAPQHLLEAAREHYGIDEVPQYLLEGHTHNKMPAQWAHALFEKWHSENEHLRYSLVKPAN